MSLKKVKNKIKLMCFFLIGIKIEENEKMKQNENYNKIKKKN